MSIYYNGTDFIQPIQKGYYQSVGDTAGIIVLLAFVTLLMLLFFLEAWNTRRLLDRYRLKYTFDKDIESKDITGNNRDRKLEDREKRFKKRMLKD